MRGGERRGRGDIRYARVWGVGEGEEENARGKKIRDASLRAAVRREVTTKKIF